MATSSDYNFISEPDPNLKCTICLDLASKPKQCEDCGKLYCTECIEKNGKKPCPNCRTDNPKYFKDLKSGRDIKELRVRCASMERGCSWTGTIETFDIHLAICEFALVSCPNGCEDGKDALKLLRKDLRDHLKTKCMNRLMECQDCGKEGTYARITGDHDKVCAKKIVPCPNIRKGCLLSMEREKTKQHVSVCEYTEVACAYESLGCEVKMLRKDITQHETENTSSHLRLMLSKYSLREEKYRTLSEEKAIVFKLQGCANKTGNKEKFFSVPFYTHYGGYKMYIGVLLSGVGIGAGTHISLCAKVLQGRYDDQLHWPFLGTVKCELLNQLEDDKHWSEMFTFTATTNMQVGSIKSSPRFIPYDCIYYYPATNTQYLLDDTLYFRVSVKVYNHKPWLVCTDKICIQSFESKDKLLKDGEAFVFQITDYNKNKDKDFIFLSDTFYTRPNGFKMFVKVFLNGNQSGAFTHLSVYAMLLKGPFQGSVTITLLNQLSDDNHYSKTFNYEHNNISENMGDCKFICQSELLHDPLKNIQYLKVETLYFRVLVKESNHKPWLTCT